MTQHQLDRAVAAATGEAIGFIRSMGFCALVLPNPTPQSRYLGRSARSRHWRKRRPVLATKNGAPTS